MLQPVVRRTWAPRGQTPIHYSWDRRDRLPAISALAVSPERRRLDLYFDICDHNIVTDDFETFAEGILRRLQGPVIFVIDRWQVHRAGASRLLRRISNRVEIEWLPPYAPELNPVEQVWSHTKYADLANYIPDDIVSLGQAVAASIRSTRAQTSLLRSFFRHCKLEL